MLDIEQALKDSGGSHLDELNKLAIQREDVMLRLLDGLWEKNETIRYNCYRVLCRLSEKHPADLITYWDRFVEQLESENTYHIISALDILANLVHADTDDRGVALFETVSGLLDSRSLVVIRYVIRNAGKMAGARPRLKRMITDRLLDVENLHHKQVELIKSDVIEAFDSYFDIIDEPKTIVDFVQRQLSSESPRTRKLAKSFLARHGG